MWGIKQKATKEQTNKLTDIDKSMVLPEANWDEGG